MSYKQLRYVLEQVKGFHRKLSAYYAETSDRVEDERAKLLLDFMGRHEARIQSSLARYQEETAQSILDTWFQFVPENPLGEALEDLDLDPKTPLEEVIRTALRADEHLIALYRQLESATSVPRVQELFGSLLELERSKETEYARSVLAEVQGRA